MDEIECECGNSLHWNYLRGTFDCDQCHRLFQFHAGQLILMKASGRSFYPASG